MKKSVAVTAAVAALAGVLGLAGCGGTTAGGSAEPAQEQPAKPDAKGFGKRVAIKPSPDKYTWYVKDYRGMNAASIGYTALDCFRRDRYGEGIVKIVYVAPDGTFIDPEDEELLKQYVVVGQNVEPNTEIKLTFEVDEDGVEYENLTSYVSLDEIVLAVDKTGSRKSHDTAMTPLEISPDKYTHYIRDYVGRNLAECGYSTMGGFFADSYGDSWIRLTIVTEDGAAVDIEDKAALAQYVVVDQDVAPNTAMSYTYSKDLDGVEYSNLVSSKTLEGLTLYVTKLEA